MRRIVIAVALAAMTAACAQGRYETSYPDFVTARQQDAVDRGWIPDFLPEQAQDLREAHLPEQGPAVVRATLPGGVLPDACVVVDDVGEVALDAAWLPDGPATQLVSCGDWEGRLHDTTLVLWTEDAPEDPE